MVYSKYSPLMLFSEFCIEISLHRSYLFVSFGEFPNIPPKWIFVIQSSKIFTLIGALLHHHTLVQHIDHGGVVYIYLLSQWTDHQIFDVRKIGEMMYEAFQ